MVVGITRVTLALPGNDSLKGKRSVVKKLLERVRARFHLSAAEVAAHDSLQRAVLGFATVGSDGRKVATVLERMVDFIDDAGLAQVVAVEQETVNYGDDTLGEDVWGSYAEKFGADDVWPPEGVAPAGRGTRGPGIEGSGHRVRIRPGSLGFGSRNTVETDDDAAPPAGNPQDDDPDQEEDVVSHRTAMLGHVIRRNHYPPPPGEAQGPESPRADHHHRGRRHRRPLPGPGLLHRPRRRGGHRGDRPGAPGGERLPPPAPGQGAHRPPGPGPGVPL